MALRIGYRHTGSPEFEELATDWGMKWEQCADAGGSVPFAVPIY
jgi:hypothetical protein